MVSLKRGIAGGRTTLGIKRLPCISELGTTSEDSVVVLKLVTG